jgi:hypothetical protein
VRIVSYLRHFHPPIPRCYTILNKVFNMQPGTIFQHKVFHSQTFHICHKMELRTSLLCEHTYAFVNSLLICEGSVVLTHFEVCFPGKFNYLILVTVSSYLLSSSPDSGRL